MKIKKFIENFLIIMTFVIVIAFPWVATFLGVENNLQGAEEKVPFSYENLDKYIIQNFPGREILVRTKNQIMYSLFDVSPNNSIAKIDNRLYSTEALNYYLHGLHKTTNEEMDNTIAKFLQLKSILDVKGKKMIVITTPTKPRYSNKKYPFADDVILAYQNPYGQNSYEIFKGKMKMTNLNYFDSIDYIENHKDTILDGDIPLFYNSGHHWSNYKGNLVGLGLIDYMKKNMELELPTFEIKSSPSNAAQYPDSDLFEVLNIYDVPNEKFYSSIVDYKEYATKEYNFLIQGGSFLGELLFPYMSIGFNNKIVHIENKNCLYNRYCDNLAFDDYDDLDNKFGLLKQLKDFDVFVFEINELNVYNATFGFLDYLLEHKDKL